MKEKLLQIAYWFLSIRRGCISTRLSSARINAIVSFVENNNSRYYSDVKDGSFKIMDKISRSLVGGMGRVQNSFAPLVEAKTNEEAECTRIEYTIRMRYITMVFVVAIRAFLLVTFITGIVLGIIELINAIATGVVNEELYMCLTLVSGLPIFEFVIFLAYALPAHTLEEYMKELFKDGIEQSE